MRRQTQKTRHLLRWQEAWAEGRIPHSRVIASSAKFGCLGTVGAFLVSFYWCWVGFGGRVEEWLVVFPREQALYLVPVLSREQWACHNCLDLNPLDSICTVSRTEGLATGFVCRYCSVHFTKALLYYVNLSFLLGLRAASKKSQTDHLFILGTCHYTGALHGP